MLETDIGALDVLLLLWGFCLFVYSVGRVRKDKGTYTHKHNTHIHAYKVTCTYLTNNEFMLKPPIVVHPLRFFLAFL